MSKLVNLLNRQKAGDLTRALLIPALGKLCVQGKLTGEWAPGSKVEEKTAFLKCKPSAGHEARLS
eukprot:1141296-Pelagomonas_calceolata.AAC.7